MTALRRAAPLLVLLHAVLVAADVLPHYDALLHVPVTVLFAAWAFPLERRWRRASAVGYFLVFAASLAVHQLTTGYGGRHALVGGLLPWSDAEGFLTNVWRALHGLPFSSSKSTTGMRPLYPTTLAALLALVGQHLFVALAVYDALVAALMGLVAERLGARYGRHAFAGVLVVLAYSLRRSGFVLATESFGLVAGLVAFEAFATALDRGAVARGPLLPAAFFVLGLGNMARPGPLLAMPLLLVWLQLRGRSTRLTAACAVAFGLAVAANVAVVKTAADPRDQIGGEFLPILYGAMHGEDYTYLAERHPEIPRLPAREKVPATLAVVRAELAERPWLVLGFLQGAAAFVGSPHGHVSLVLFDPDDAYFERVAPLEGARRAGAYRCANLVAIAALGIAFAGLTWRGLWRRRRQRGEPDLLAECAQVVFVGALVSACLTPPWITEAAQLQTTTLAFFAVLPWVYGGAATPQVDETRRVLGMHLAFVATVLGAWLFVVTRRSDVPAEACQADSRDVFVEPSVLRRVHSPVEGGFTLARLEENLARLRRHNPKLVGPLLGEAREGLGLAMVFDGCAERTSIVVGDASALLALPRGWHRLRLAPVDLDGRIFRLP